MRRWFHLWVALAAVIAGVGLWPAVRPGADPPGSSTPLYVVFTDWQEGDNVRGVRLARVDPNGNAFGTLFFKDGTQFPGYWLPEGFQPLLLGSGLTGGDAYDANRWGETVGDQFVKPSGTSQPTVWEEGDPFLLGRPGENGVAEAINDPGQIGGFHQVGNRYAACFFLRDGTTQDIPGLSAFPISYVKAINNTGSVTGTLLTPDFKHQGVWILDPATGTARRLPEPAGGYTDSDAAGLNNTGQVAGTWLSGLSTAAGPFQAFSYDASTGKAVPLSTPPGYNSRALDINDSGAVSGYLQKQGGGVLEAAIWPVPNTLVHLQDVMDPKAGFVPNQVFGINENGWIGVFGQEANNGKHHVTVLARSDQKGGSCSKHYTPTDDSPPEKRTGVWCDDRLCQGQMHCHLISRNPKDPKDEKDEGQHGKDDPLPYDRSRIYTCSCQ